MALTQQRYTYRHNQVLLLLATKLKEMFRATKSICVYADLHGWRSSESPQAIIPSALVSTLFRPDIVVYSSATLSVALLELTCPLDLNHNILSARSRKQLNICNCLQNLTICRYPITMKYWKLANWVIPTFLYCEHQEIL